ALHRREIVRRLERMAFLQQCMRDGQHDAVLLLGADEPRLATRQKLLRSRMRNQIHAAASAGSPRGRHDAKRNHPETGTIAANRAYYCAFRLSRSARVASTRLGMIVLPS